MCFLLCSDAVNNLRSESQGIFRATRTSLLLPFKAKPNDLRRDFSPNRPQTGPLGLSIFISMMSFVGPQMYLACELNDVYFLT